MYYWLQIVKALSRYFFFNHFVLLLNIIFNMLLQHCSVCTVLLRLNEPLCTNEKASLNHWFIL